MDHYGTYGVLTSIGPKIQCHLCGRPYDLLSCHVWKTHEMHPNDYRVRFGIPKGTGLVSDRVHVKLRQKLNRMVEQGVPGFRATRRKDPGDLVVHACDICGAPVTQRRRAAHQRKLCDRPACRLKARELATRAMNQERTTEDWRRYSVGLSRYISGRKQIHAPSVCRFCGAQFPYVRRKRYCSHSCAAKHREQNPAYAAQKRQRAIEQAARRRAHCALMSPHADQSC